LVIDTSVLVDHLLNHQEAKRFLEHTGAQKSISAITATELLAGTGSRSSQRRTMLLELIDEHDIIPVSRSIAILAGDIVRDHQLAIPDAIIAATAILHNATLMTRDRKAHTRVPGLRVIIPY